MRQPSGQDAPTSIPVDGPEGIAPAPPTTGTGDPGHGTRVFGWSYDTAPSVTGPIGPLNVGYCHNTVSDEARWARGELPDQGYGYAFALRRPKLMREPGTNLGTYNMARG